MRALRRWVVMTAAEPLALLGPTGAAVMALRLSTEARGVCGLDVLHRSVDRAPPTQA